MRNPVVILAWVASLVLAWLLSANFGGDGDDTAGRGGTDRVVTVVEGDAHETVSQLNGPVDMVFIDAEGAIVGIVERAVPHSLETISVEKPVLAVLELNGGTVSRLGLQLGDLVRHSAFKRES